MSHFCKYLQKSGNVVISQINQAAIILLSLGEVTPLGMTDKCKNGNIWYKDDRWSYSQVY